MRHAQRLGHHSVEHLVGRWVSVQEFCLLGSRLRVSVEEISTSRPSFQSCSPRPRTAVHLKSVCRRSRQWSDVALLRQCSVGSMDVYWSKNSFANPKNYSYIPRIQEEVH